MDSQQNPTDYLVDTLVQLLIDKNPTFITEKERYKEEIKAQFEMYLMTQMMNLLSEEKYNVFSQMLIDEPFEKEKHNEFLAENIDNFSDKILEFSQAYLVDYRNFIQNMQ